jgi:hypothetical protein
MRVRAAMPVIHALIFFIVPSRTSDTIVTTPIFLALLRHMLAIQALTTLLNFPIEGRGAAAFKSVMP